MKNFKILVILLITLGLLGCLNNQVPNNEKPLKIWYAWNGQEEKELVSSLKEYGNRAGIEIELRQIPFATLQSKFQEQTKNESGPDLIIGPSDWIGVFKDLDYIEEIGKYLPKNIDEDFIKTALDGCKNNNEIYALPESMKLCAMYYNKDLIKSIPQNTDEMIKISKELMNSGKIKYGLVYDYNNYYYHAGWVGGFGESILNSDNNPTFNSMGQINAVKFVDSLRSGKNKIMPELVDYNVMMTLFIDKQCPMIITGPWALTDFKNTDLNLEVGEIPMVSSTGLNPKPFVGIEGMMLSKKSNKKEKGIEIIKYFASEEFQMKMAKLNHIPSRKSVYQMEEVKKYDNFKFLEGFRKQAEKGYTLPTNVEMSLGIWPNGANLINDILEKKIDAVEAGEKAQSNAMNAIEKYRKNRK